MDPVEREALMDVNMDLATSLAITTLVVGIVFLARLIRGLADHAGLKRGDCSACEVGEVLAP